MEIANAVQLVPSCIHARTAKKFTMIIQNAIVAIIAAESVHNEI